MLFIYGLGMLTIGWHVQYHRLNMPLGCLHSSQGLLRLLKRRTASFTENPIYFAVPKAVKAWGEIWKKEQKGQPNCFLEYIMSSGFFSSQMWQRHINSSFSPFSIQRNHVDSGQYEADRNNKWTKLGSADWPRSFCRKWIWGYMTLEALSWLQKK